MNNSTVFDVSPEDLKKLSPKEAVAFFQELLWATAHRLNVPLSKINISLNLYAADGGIDATVRENFTQDDLIKVGITRYQIKTGAFVTSSSKIDSVIKGELFKGLTKGQRISKEKLGKSVRECLDSSGTYVLVCFGMDLIDLQLTNVITSITKFFQKCGYTNPKVEVLSQNNLQSFLKAFPSLALTINQNTGGNFRNHDQWSKDSDMSREPFEIGANQKEFMTTLFKSLTENNAGSKALHIHIYGEPGSGKTKLVLEATRKQELSPLVLYYSSGQSFLDDPLHRKLQMEDNYYNVLLIIDNCEHIHRIQIWNSLKNCGSRIQLVTINNEKAEGIAGINIKAPTLDEERIRTIIEHYVPNASSQSIWFARHCDGAPLAAHVIGENLKDNPDNLLKNPSDIDIWSRYIAGTKNINSEEIKNKKRVLRYLALFKRFGYANKMVSKEAEIIWKLIQQNNPQISFDDFREIVEEFRNRNILKGDVTLYITPLILQVYLWTEWWHNYSSNFNLAEFISELETFPQLLAWFLDMFRYAHLSSNASNIVEDILGVNGLFQKNPLLFKDRVFASFFGVLTEANPKLALGCLKKTIGTWNKQELMEFNAGRREILWALQKIAVWRELFVGAANLLLALGEAENDNYYSNNASGIFVELFSNGFVGSLAPTEASPAERFPVLQEAITSKLKERRLLAIRACRYGLISDNFARVLGPEFQGLHNQPKLWVAKTYGELFNAYRRIWNLLVTQIDILPEDEQKFITSILISTIYTLGTSPNLFEMVVNSMAELANKPYISKRDLLTTILQMLDREKELLADEVRRSWEQLRDSLLDSDLPNSNHYIGITSLRDLVDEKGNIIQESYHIKELARLAVEDEMILLPKLDRLMTEDIQQSHYFGYELGKADKEFSLLSVILDAQRAVSEKANVLFLSGYLRALLESDEAKWEAILDDIAQDEKLCVWLPKLAEQTKLTDKIALNILSLAKDNLIQVSAFQFFVGIHVKAISQEIVEKWLAFLISKSEVEAFSIALNILYYYYIFGSSKYPLPQLLSIEILTNEFFFQSYKKEGGNYYAWNQVSEVFISEYPEYSLELAKLIVSHFGEQDVITLHPFSRENVLNKIARLYPEKVWHIVTKYLGGEINSKTYAINEWLRGSSDVPINSNSGGMLKVFSRETIWKWVDEDIENRAAYIATIVPKTFFDVDTHNSLAREVLLRYGHREDVRENLKGNFRNGGGIGSISSRFEIKKQQLLDFKMTETEEIIRDWIDDFVRELAYSAEYFRILEERGEL